MNKITLLFCASCLSLLFACTKSTSGGDQQQPPNPPDPPNPPATRSKFGVSFRLGNIDVQKDGRIAFKEMAAGEYLRYLFYGAYDSTGALASKKVQDLTNGGSAADFGVITDSLAPGKYTVILGGGNMNIFDVNNNADNLVNLLKFYSGDSQDVFYKKVNLIVGSKDTAYSGVRLNRITSAVEVKITDTLPPIVTQISVKLDNQPVYFSPYNDAVVDVDSVLFSSNYSVSSASIDFNCFTTTNKHSVTITGYSADNKPVYQKTIENVQLDPNKQTVLQGTLSDAPYGQHPMVVTVDPDYSESITYNF
jgi:hypothetical protein